MCLNVLFEGKSGKTLIKPWTLLQSLTLSLTLLSGQMSIYTSKDTCLYTVPD